MLINKIFGCCVSKTTGCKMAKDRQILILETEADVIAELSNIIERRAREAIEKNGTFKIGVSGGSVCTFLCKGLPYINTEWAKWKLFFCDERVVSFDNDDSTFRLYRESLVGVVPLKETQFVTINPTLGCKEAAKNYEASLKIEFPDVSWPQFDLLMLGVGPDGHTCSLFPGHALLEEKTVWVAAIEDSPKPPPCRVTLTYPVINNAKCCVFAMTGTGKAEMVKRLLQDEENLPANKVKPTSGELIWILDKTAASQLKE